MCPLRSSIDTEPLSLTPHGVDTCFIYHPFNVKNYLIGHKSETGQQKKHPLNHATHLCTLLQIYGSKFKIPICTEIKELFQQKDQP